MRTAMKKFPFHLRTKRSGKSDETSIALIITLAVMSLLLVLVLTFATVTRVEIQTATSNRDLVASKYLAQAALQRAIADLAGDYVRTVGATNTGLSGTWSEIAPTNDVTWVTGFSTNFVTDIERVGVDPISGKPVTAAGSDGIIDYVALPGNISNFAEGTPQWIGMKDTNGQLLGRIAFLANGNALCINSVGNIEQHATFAGQPINSRNEGSYAPEVNLVSALMALGWSKADATNDVGEILRYRYGADLYPGLAGIDEDTNNARFVADNIDNDGNGQVDQAGEGVDDPQEYLCLSDETNSAQITPAFDDVAITDLKQLHTLAGFSAGMKGRFLSNFSRVQQTFVTQSPVKMDVTATNLNWTNFQGNQTLMFNCVSNQIFALGNSIFGDDDRRKVQVACNIVSFQDTNNVAPYSIMYNNEHVVGVGEVPHINEIVYTIVANVSKQGMGAVLPPFPATNLQVSLSGNVTVEVWYPYTNNFPRSGAYACDLVITQAIRNVHGDFFPLNPVIASQANFLSGAPAFAATPSLAATTNAAQFRTNIFPFALGGAYNSDIQTVVNIGLTNFDIGAVLRQNGGSGAALDSWPMYTSPNYVVFDYASLTNVVAGPANVLNQKLTAYVSFALNDPRVKPTNLASLGSYLEYTGIASSISHSLLARNPTNTLIPGTNLPIFSVLNSNSDDYAVANLGITNKTFFVPKTNWWRSAAELGRVHRGDPWQTIDFKAGGRDRYLLDKFTVFKTQTGTNANYRHGLVNLNSPATQFPVWAGLFGGMPLWDGSFVDYDNSGPIGLSKTSNLVSALTSTKYQTLSDLCEVASLSSMRTNYGIAWPDQRSDEEKEWILSHILNLSSTRGSGNFFTIWAWGQSLKGGGNMATQKVVAAETLIVAMVKIETVGTNASMRVVYFRYNPDLEFVQTTEPLEAAP